MDIHHAMMVRNRPDRLYQALTRPEDLSVWMDAPATAQAEVGSMVEFQYDQGKRSLKVRVTRLEEGRLVQWRVVQPMWPADAIELEQTVTWTLTPYESSTLVDFRMQGWREDDEAYASVSYKWASFMMRLKIYMGDIREIASLLPIKGGNGF